MNGERDNNDFRMWAHELNAGALNVWREAMAQLRQLHGDVWNGVRFFVTVNGVIVAAAFGIAKLQDKDVLTWALIVSLASVGIIVTAVARSILGKHRDHYLGMLLRKTLVERELGFYDRELSSGVDLSFPWKVDKQHLERMAAAPSRWLAEQKRRKGTITRRLFLVYEGVIIVHALILIAAVLGLCVGYFG